MTHTPGPPNPLLALYNVGRLLHEARTCLQRFTCEGPIPIRFELEPYERVNGGCDIKIIGLMRTILKNDPRGPVRGDIAREVFIPLFMMTTEELESYITLAVRQLAEQMWMHELTEWLMLDGKPIIDPHPTMDMGELPRGNAKI